METKTRARIVKKRAAALNSHTVLFVDPKRNTMLSWTTMIFKEGACFVSFFNLLL